MNGVDVREMRAHFSAVTAWGLECGEWSAAEIEEMGLDIKSALEGDVGYVLWWAGWLQAWAGVVELLRQCYQDIDQAALATARSLRGL